MRPDGSSALTVKEVAARLSTTPAIVRRLIRSGRLRALKLSPRNFRILVRELDRFIDG